MGTKNNIQVFNYKGKIVHQVYDPNSEDYSYICDGIHLETIHKLEVHIQPKYLARFKRKSNKKGDAD